jgi:hypothetical protein
MPPPVTAVSDNQVTSKGKVIVPPEERFWQRHSPHHEFPLSTVVSIVMYIVGGFVLWAVIQLAVRQREGNESLPVASVALGDDPDAGGGGNPQGVEGSPNPGNSGPAGKEAIRPAPADQTASAAPTPNDAKLTEVAPRPVELPELVVDGRTIEIEHAAQEALSGLAGISEKARADLLKGLGAPAKGLGGPGTGGGLGSGNGPGVGSGTKPGVQGTSGKLDPDRIRRTLRWVMQFNTRDGKDYLRQMRELGAILAVPVPQGGYLVIRDLSKVPAQGEKESLDSIQRIFWIDDKRESVQSLAQALGLPYHPPHMIAFFPESLEKELLEKELKFRNRKEGQIRATYFRVVNQGGRSTPMVVEQR